MVRSFPRDRELFASFDSTEAGVQKSCEEGFGVDETFEGFFHKGQLAKIHKAWSVSRIDIEVKLKVDAVARAHGERVTLLAVDWESLVTQCKSKHGIAIDQPPLDP